MSVLPTAAPLLATRGLSLYAAGRCLVQALDWQVSPGERWCVIGRNAAGKSTLLRALAGLPVPSQQGQVLWLGRPQGDWASADAAHLRAYAPQQVADRFPISVQRLLDLSTVRPSALRADELLTALDAQALAERGVLELSGGERQRIALAQCALQGAPLLLMGRAGVVPGPGAPEPGGPLAGHIGGAGQCIGPGGQRA